MQPDNQAAQLGLGAALFQTEAFEEALAIYTKLLQQDPNNLQAAESIGLILLQQGNTDAAIAALERAAALAPRPAKFR